MPRIHGIAGAVNQLAIMGQTLNVLSGLTKAGVCGLVGKIWKALLS